MAGLRVVLDTNVLVSGLAYPGSVPGRIVGAWRRGGLDVVLSKYILDEMVRVLPKLLSNKRSPAEVPRPRRQLPVYGRDFRAEWRNGRDTARQGRPAGTWNAACGEGRLSDYR